MNKRRTKKGGDATKKQRTKNTHPDSSRYVLLGIILIILIGTLLFLSKLYSPITDTYLPETPHNTMKKIPSDVKKTYLTPAPKASISAALNIPILMYHYVEYVQNKKDTERQLLNVDPNVFEKQIQTLQNAGYTFITARDLGEILDGIKQVPTKPIILTFDDGHWDLATEVLPILKKYHIHATAYIVPGFIGTNTDSLTPQELKEIIQSGLIDIGDHTVHHIALKGQSLARVKYEVDHSKAMLENTYHIHVYSFAYPYGSFDQQAIDVVKQAGFTTAASTIAGNQQNNQNRYFLFRVRPGYMTGQALINYLNIHWQPYTK